MSRQAAETLTYGFAVFLAKMGSRHHGFTFTNVQHKSLPIRMSSRVHRNGLQGAGNLERRSPRHNWKALQIKSTKGSNLGNPSLSCDERRLNTDEMMQKTQCTTRFVHFIVGISHISYHAGKMVAYIDKITLCSETLQYTVPCLLNSACVKLSTNVQR